MLILKSITLFLEAALAIPVVGGIMVVASGYTLLYVAALLHLAAGIVAIVQKEPKRSVVHWVGLAGNAMAWIPVFGWFVHGVMTVWLLIDVLKAKKSS